MVLLVFVLTHVTSCAEPFTTDRCHTLNCNSVLIPHVRHEEMREENHCTHWIEAVRCRLSTRGSPSGVRSHDGCLAPTSRGGARKLA